jgi:NAD(P)H dehydrogenase (quinone)
MADAPRPRHLVVIGHPRPGSFNHQVAEAYCKGVRDCWHEAEIRDLYAIGFDPLLREERAADVEHELALVQSCQVLVFVYPIWFGTPPAIIKGYVERVLGAGFRPETIKNGESALTWHDKRLLTLSTSATALPWLHAQGQWNALRQAFDQYLATLLGFRSTGHVHFDAVVSKMPERYRLELLGRATDAARSMCSKIAQERHGAAARRAVDQQYSDLAGNG